MISDTSARPLLNLRVNLDKAAMVIGLLVEGMTIRGASRLTRLHQQTVLNILETAGQKCAALLDERIRGIQNAVIEADELYSYVGVRPENAPPSRIDIGDIYGFIATDRNTKLIVSTLIAKRTKANCMRFMQDLKSRLMGRPQLSTDGFPAYCSAGGAVPVAFGADVDYGIEVKKFASEEDGPRRYTPARLSKVIRAKCIGNPAHNTISTAKVERLNLTVRHFCKRFARATPGYSKKIQNHRHAFSVFVAYFNFCRPHSSLKKETARTPAMAAGLADRPWTIAELLRGGG